MRRIVIVGASLAGLRAAEALRSEGFEGELHLVGTETYPPYSRPPLSKGLLTGAQQVEDCLLHPTTDIDARWWLGRSAHALDLERRSVRAGERRLDYDGLVIASGARPRAWPQRVPDGVVTFRELDDALLLRDALRRPPRRVVVVGAGFLGGEIASSCTALGVPVTLVELEQAPLANRLGHEVATFLARLHREHGVDLQTGVTVDRFVGDPALRRVELSDGTSLEADLAIVALGIHPNVEWLAGSGLRVRGGVLCDAYLRCVGAQDVLAAGDVARWPHPLFGGETLSIGHWTNAVDQARTAAHNLLSGDGGQPFATVPSFWTDLHGIKLRSVGLPALADEHHLAEGSFEAGRFVYAYGRRGTLIGAVSVGMNPRMPIYRRLIEQRQSIGSVPQAAAALSPQQVEPTPR